MKLVVVVGPTASGKTGLALRLAEAASAEVVSADSQQSTGGWTSGTGKATRRSGPVRHHLLDVVESDEP